MFKPPGECPVCGEDVRRGAAACPSCGADDRSGWKDDDDGNGLDLPSGDFNYNEFLENEFGGGGKPRGLNPVWWIAGIIVLAAFTLAFAL